jgi:2-polyprenyl-3-methyl-5-hydroxy-6-metoxy-1,4-benzoquinol methylase
MSPFASLAQRHEREEEMDALSLPEARYQRVLVHLARVNTVTLSRRPPLAFVRRILTALPEGSPPLRLLDVGFGHGDLLRAIARLAAQMRRGVVLVGVDLNPRSATAARAATPPTLAIEWITGDHEALAGQGWDVIVSSLVTHHMHDAERIAFLRFMEAEAAIGWLVSDLHRRRLPFVGFPVLAALLGVDPIVRRDGQLSIARSFRPAEWRRMLAAAGIEGAQVRRRFPWRLCVERIKPP